MMFDARQIARGWLAVALAASDDRDRPQLFRTVHIEEHTAGLRLVATDSYVLLHAFVPNLEHDDTDYPALDEAPIATATAMDPHGRGKGFLGHVLKLATAYVDGMEPDPIDIRVNLNVAASVRDAAQGTLAGLEARAVVLEYPGVERIELDVYDGGYPDVRYSLEAAGVPAPTSRILLKPEIVARLAKIGKLHPAARIGWTWGGEDRPARLMMVDSDPHIDGLVMPVRWDFATNGPADVGPPPDDDEGQAEELEGQTAIPGAPDVEALARENWTESRRRGLDVARRAFPEAARIGVGMWNDEGPPIVAPAPARWLLDRGLLMRVIDDKHVELTPAGAEVWDALRDLPHADGPSAEEIGGDPCGDLEPGDEETLAEVRELDPFAGFPR